MCEVVVLKFASPETRNHFLHPHTISLDNEAFPYVQVLTASLDGRVCLWREQVALIEYSMTPNRGRDE